MNFSENNEIFYTLLEVNNPAFRAMATEMDERIELISKVLHFILTKLTVAGIHLPPIVLTAINYFIYDLKDDSYVLPFPLMYVR